MQPRRVGLDAVLIEVSSDAAVRAVFAEATRRREAGLLQAVEIVPAARTVLLDGVDADRVVADLASWRLHDKAAEGGDLLELATVYDGADREDVARLWDCTVAEVGSIHASFDYVVAFCGFAPGFAYCTGLPSTHHVPRRSTPRSSVPTGSLALAGGYCGVYPRPSPGGWQLIGRVLEPVWRESANEPALLTPGTRIRFVS